MAPPQSQAERFLALHRKGEPLLQPNAWDVGSARLLEALGFAAIATTSSGFAATLGRLDGGAKRDDHLGHFRALTAALDIPVAADTENGFADDPGGVAETVRLAAQTGLAGCSIEDWSGTAIYDVGLAVERIAAAAETARAGDRLVLTARCENLIRERPDLGDTIDRLQRYQEAGADVLFAPGLRALDDIHAVVTSVDRPVNVLVTSGCPPLAELASVGVARISVGGAFAYNAYGSLIDAANELRDAGTYGFSDKVPPARAVIRNAFGQ